MNDDNGNQFQRSILVTGGAGFIGTSCGFSSGNIRAIAS